MTPAQSRRSSTVRQAIDLSVVIPAFREANKIAADVHAADKYLRDRRVAGEIIVVDDGSPDDTAAIAQSLGGEIPSLRVLAYRPNRGKGCALRTGMAATKGRIIMFADAGLCVPYDDADVGRALVDGTADIAIGSRRTVGSEILQAQPFYRQAGSRMFGLLIRTFFGFSEGVHDTQCGFKVFRGEVGRRLYAHCVVDRMMIDLDMLCRAARLGYRVVEFPVHWTNDPDTRFKPVSGSWHNAVELARIWWDLNLRRRKRDAGA